MINTVVLTGRLGKDLELKYTGSGKAVASGSLGVSQRFTDQNGERGTDWINLVFWGKSAEIVAQHTHKGSLIGVEGRLQTRSYENQQGNKVYVTEVIVNNFSFLEKRGDNNTPNNGGNIDPFSNQNATRAQQTGFTNDDFYGKHNGAPELSDDDMPF